MELLEGIKVYLPDGPATLDQGRFELSSGVLPAAECPQAGRYAADSFVPRVPWSAPSAREQRLLHSTTPPTTPVGEWIGLFRVPREVLAAFAPLREAIRAGVGPPEVRRMVKSPAGQAAKAFALEFAATLAQLDRPVLEGAVVACGPAGRLTATQDRDGRAIGLHVDSWYRLPLDQRTHAPNRLSINLGVEARALLYINLPLQSVAQLLDQHFPDEEARHGVGIGLRTVFMWRFPDYPVTKLRVEPGEAYIAPTENLIHDGWTADQAHADLQFNVRGRFMPAQNSLSAPC